MPALHIMTFNVQCLPWGVNLINGIQHDAIGRANRICDDVLAQKSKDLPDVIAFNEVFSEDARKIFLTRLGALYLYVIDEVDKFRFMKFDDSGLMLFSRYPLLQLNTGDTLHSEFYEEGKGPDEFAPKAVGFVRIEIPIIPTTIAFTHMQASYNFDSEYREVRESQFKQIMDAFGDLMTDQGQWGGAILLGDLNVRGDKGMNSNEWSDIFDNPDKSPIGRMLDGWRTYMHPPPENGKERDPGYTNLDHKNGTNQRLDYTCFPRRNLADLVLVPHHMFIRFNSQSDHFGLESIIQLWSPHCTPSDAIEFKSALVAFGETFNSPSSIKILGLNFEHEGSYQWIYLDSGTYSWWSGDINGKRLHIRAYEEDNLSRVLETQEIDAVDLEGELHFFKRHPMINPIGRTVLATKPFFLAVRMAIGQPGQALLSIMTHFGESKITALELSPHQILTPAFIKGKRLGIEDTCWFRAKMPSIYSGAERIELFKVNNPSFKVLKLELETDGLGSSKNIQNSNSIMEIFHSTNGITVENTAETIYIKMIRTNIDSEGFSIKWKSPITYLRLDKPIDLFINDETGPDIFGSDEVRLQIFVDSDPLPLFSGEWNDANTGDVWPGLHQKIRQRALTRISGDRLGFVQSLSIVYWEEDITAKGSQIHILNTLAEGDEDTVSHRISLKVNDPISDGLYTFSCSLSKVP